MYLKLDKLNRVRIQIYMVLIAYLILQLMRIPKFYGEKVHPTGIESALYNHSLEL